MDLAVTEMTNWAVDLIDVRKTYGRRIQALGGVSIQVGRGEIFGLLGPNGAGKTTLVKIMMSVVRPDSAYGTVLGRPIGHRGKLARIGYLPESHRFPGYLTGAQVLDFYAALAKVPRQKRAANVEKWLHRVGMTQWASTRIRKYSKGMMQRLGLAQALMNDPEMVVLDEPTDGVDPVGRRSIRELLIELKRAGTTVFLNSHMLSELEMVCDRVAILVGGMVARQGTLKELTDHTLEYQIRCGGDVAALTEKIQGLGGRCEDGAVILAGHDPQKLNALIDVLRAGNVLIDSVEPRRFSLEDILVEAMGAETGAGAAAAPIGIARHAT
ncbi:MAG: ABC transporter ATP-binding protein [Phycisphaerales bacterium]|nr:MAG: ABC transporter ATP-binding protein [Phycisphaerales bacterium]